MGSSGPKTRPARLRVAHARHRIGPSFPRAICDHRAMTDVVVFGLIVVVGLAFAAGMVALLLQAARRWFRRATKGALPCPTARCGGEILPTSEAFVRRCQRCGTRVFDHEQSGAHEAWLRHWQSRQPFVTESEARREFERMQNPNKLMY